MISSSIMIRIPKNFDRGSLFALVCFALVSVASLRAQVPQASPTPAAPEAVGPPTSAMVLVSLVPKPAPIQCIIGTNNVIVDGTAEAISPGFSTGLIPWRPEKESLHAVAKGYDGAELKPFLKPGETPVVLLTETPPGHLAFRLIPNTEIRTGGFYDAINMTPDSSLQIKVDGKMVSLPKGERTRLGTKNKLSYAVPKGPEDTLDSGEDPPQYLMIFYRSAAGRTECAVVPDMLLQ